MGTLETFRQGIVAIDGQSEADNQAGSGRHGKRTAAQFADVVQEKQPRDTAHEQSEDASA